MCPSLLVLVLSDSRAVGLAKGCDRLEPGGMKQAGPSWAETPLPILGVLPLGL